jgi:hypothetical protein
LRVVVGVSILVSLLLRRIARSIRDSTSSSTPSPIPVPFRAFALRSRSRFRSFLLSRSPASTASRAASRLFTARLAWVCGMATGAPSSSLSESELSEGAGEGRIGAIVQSKRVFGGVWQGCA